MHNQNNTKEKRSSETDSPASAENFLPKVHRIEKARDSVKLVLFVPPTLEFFAGHFPEMPIVPGYVLVGWALFFARRHLHINYSNFEAKNIKFLKVVTPGQELFLSINLGQKSVAEFSYTSTDKKVSFCTGNIAFK